MSYKVKFKNEEHENSSQMKILQHFISTCVNTPYKLGKMHPLKRAMLDFRTSGKASVGGKVFDQQEVFGELKSFNPVDYFEITQI